MLIYKYQDSYMSVQGRGQEGDNGVMAAGSGDFGAKGTHVLRDFLGSQQNLNVLNTTRRGGPSDCFQDGIGLSFHESSLLTGRQRLIAIKLHR